MKTTKDSRRSVAIAHGAGMEADRPFTWLIIRTNPTRERRAQIGLEQRGYLTYLPVLTKNRTHGRRTDIVENPLFPGYIFVGRPGAVDRSHPAH
jgi:hypothetical protein